MIREIDNPLAVELLAPGGSEDAIEAASAYGADAVYFGVGSFNARSGADNLSIHKLEETIEYLHARTVKGYLALNILFMDSEIQEALAIAIRAAEAGIDGIIVQDLGLASLIHARIPYVSLHASTQMTITDEAGLVKCAQMGFSRVVLPRELNAETVIKLTSIAAKLNIETEVFIHGALCISYSGQCLMSGVHKSRSANRGQCSQPCRLSYDIKEYQRSGKEQSVRNSERGYKARISPKDQALIDHLPELIAAGVKSFKIEGRMRSAEYVALTVSEYRRAIDQVLNNNDADWNKRQLLVAFNRGGSFTDRYYSENTKDDFLTGSYPGSFGLFLGYVNEVSVQTGILKIDVTNDNMETLVRGDILSIRSASKEIASAPIGIIETYDKQIMVKAFHPNVLKQFRKGDMVYQMTDKTMLSSIRNNSKKKIPVKFELESIDLSNQTNASARELYGYDKDSSLIRLTATIIAGPFSGLSVNSIQKQTAANSLTSDRIEKQLAKTGGTNFAAVSLDIRDDNSSGFQLSIAQLNELRRNALSLMRRRLVEKQKPVRGIDHSWDLDFGRKNLFRQEANKKSECRIDVYYQRLPDKPEETPCGADSYIIPFWAVSNENIQQYVDAIREENTENKVFFWIPPAPQNRISDWLSANMSILGKLGINGLCSGHPGEIRPVDSDLLLQIDSGLNITNRISAEMAIKERPEAIAFSAELTLKQISDILAGIEQEEIKDIWLTLPVYGRQRLMSSVFCPVGQNISGCRRCYLPWTEEKKDNARLYDFIDKSNNRMLLQTHPRFCTMDLFDNKILLDQDMLNFKWPNKTAWRVHFMDETASERKQITALLRKLMLAEDNEQADCFNKLEQTVQTTVSRIADGIIDRRRNIYD